MGLDETARRQPVEERRERRDDNALPQVGKRRERAKPFGDDVRVRRKRVVGQGLAVGQREDRQPV